MVILRQLWEEKVNGTKLKGPELVCPTQLFLVKNREAEVEFKLRRDLKYFKI